MAVQTVPSKTNGTPLPNIEPLVEASRKALEASRRRKEAEIEARKQEQWERACQEVRTWLGDWAWLLDRAGEPKAVWHQGYDGPRLETLFWHVLFPDAAGEIMAWAWPAPWRTPVKWPRPGWWTLLDWLKST